MFLCQRFEKSMELLFYSMVLVLMPWICGSLLLFMRQLPKQGMLFTFFFWRNFFYNSQECIPSNFPYTPFPILSPVASISQMSFNIRFVLDLYIHGHFFLCILLAPLGWKFALCCWLMEQIPHYPTATPRPRLMRLPQGNFTISFHVCDNSSNVSAVI